MGDDLIMRLTEYATVIGAVIMLLAPRLAKLLKNGNGKIDGGVIAAMGRDLEFHQERADKLSDRLKECERIIAARDALIVELRAIINARN
jgi:hypothetical protein